MTSRDERKVWLNRKLSQKGVAEYGRASAISRKLDVSNAVVQGWLGGSLSRDLEVAIRFSEAYGFSVEEWVTLIPVENKNNESWKDYVLAAKEFEAEHGNLTTKQFMFIVELIANDSAMYKNNQAMIAEVIGLNQPVLDPATDNNEGEL